MGTEGGRKREQLVLSQNSVNTQAEEQNSKTVQHKHLSLNCINKNTRLDQHHQIL